MQASATHIQYSCSADTVALCANRPKYSLPGSMPLEDDTLDVPGSPGVPAETGRIFKASGVFMSWAMQLLQVAGHRGAADMHH